MNLRDIANEALLITALSLPGCTADPEICKIQPLKANSQTAYSPLEATEICQANRNELMTCIKNKYGNSDTTVPIEIFCSDAQLGLHIGRAFQDSEHTVCVLGGATVSCEN